MKGGGAFSVAVGRKKPPQADAAILFWGSERERWRAPARNGAKTRPKRSEKREKRAKTKNQRGSTRWALWLAPEPEMRREKKALARALQNKKANPIERVSVASSA